MDVEFWHDPHSGRWGMSGRRRRHRLGRRFRRGILKFALLRLVFALLKLLLEVPRYRYDLARASGSRGRPPFEEQAGNLSRFFDDDYEGGHFLAGRRHE
jgi:hypothetical protein